MKLILIFFCGLLALVAAADTGAKEQCAKICDPRDSCCIAKCYQVPCPSESQVDDTHDCVAACPQGTGSPADTQKYADCEQRCFDTHYLPAAGVAATTTSSGATASSTTTSGTTTFSSTTAFTTTSSDTIASGTSASGTHTTQTDTTANSDSISSKESDSASPTSAAHTTNAAVNIQISALSVSIFGLVIAAFAL